MALYDQHLHTWFSTDSEANPPDNVRKAVESGLAGVTAVTEADPTHNPLDRLRLSVDPAAANITAWELADRLSAGAPPVIVRDHEVEHGYFYLDPCNLHPGEASVVAERIVAELAAARARPGANHEPATARRRRRFTRLLTWPD